KSNSLDALCKRLEVDNSNRALHGALLDAGLLADVYINMTRGQNSLVIDAVEDAATNASLAAIDFGAFDLRVIAANDDEAAAHEKLLAELDKASGGKTLWRALVA
ncbi:partial DNA polymerase III subunit epsilon, partial [Planctomycetaceae bacterium]